MANAPTTGTLTRNPSAIADIRRNRGDRVACKSDGTVLKDSELALFAEVGLVPDETWTCLRKALFALVTSHRFESVCGVVILLNMILVVAETDASVNDGVADDWIVYASYGLLSFYTLELSSKLYSMRLVFFKDMWNVLDFLIVVTDLVLFGLDLLISNMPSVSILRVFRLVRLARAFKAAKSFKELNALIRSFGFALKAIFWGILMILMILVIWSILAVQLIHPVNMAVLEKNPDIYDGCHRCDRAFISVFESCLTFWQTVVAGDSWGTLALPIITEAPYTALIFLMVIVTVNLTMLNLILAVIVEAGAKATEEDLHDKAREAMKKVRKAEARLIEICSVLDEDESGSLNIEEFMHGYANNMEFADCLTSMNVTETDIDMIFNICDEDGSGDVNYFEFVEQLRRIRSSGEQMLLYYVTEIRHKVQQLKLRLLDNVTITEEELPDPFRPFGPDEKKDTEQLYVDGLGQGGRAAFNRAKDIADAEQEMARAQPPSMASSSGEQPFNNDVLARLKVAAEVKIPNSALMGQIGAGADLRDDTGGTNEDKLSLCSQQLSSIWKMNQDIATVIHDIASQSKVHTGLLNNLAADNLSNLKSQLVQDSPVPRSTRWTQQQNIFCMPDQPSGPVVVPLRAV